jgi:polyisoprenoid-binding protein YceI
MVAAGFFATSASAEFKVKLDGKNTEIAFVGTKPGGKHIGGFKKLSGHVTGSGSDVTTGKVEVVIDVKSMETDDRKLTGHLMGPDFFDAKTHPTAKFVSTKIEGDQKEFKLTGEFTLLGKTKEITIPVKVAQTDESYTLSSEFKIDRNDFGMSWGKGKVDDEVTIKLTIKAKKEDVKLQGQ